MHSGDRVNGDGGKDGTADAKADLAGMRGGIGPRAQGCTAGTPASATKDRAHIRPAEPLIASQNAGQLIQRIRHPATIAISKAVKNCVNHDISPFYVS